MNVMRPDTNPMRKPKLRPVCLILGSYYALGLTLTGLNFGFLIGFVSGLITFIPYVGSMTGLVVGGSVAVAQFWPEATPIVIVVGIFLVGQFVEGNVLAPKLVGESVGLHPVWLIFALFAFGYLLGFVGLLLAVPLAAASGVLARFALRQYLASPLYTGRPAAPQAGAAPAPGKSHLAAIWADRAGARLLSSRALSEASLPGALATGALVLEDVRPGALDEAALFHLLNLAGEEGAFILLTSRMLPVGWTVRLPD